MTRLRDKPASEWKRRGTPRRRYFVGMKRPCSECGDEIIVTESMCRNSKYTCRPCQTRRTVEYDRRNRDKLRARNKRSAAKRSGKRATKTAAYRARYPEKRRAHQAVQTAIRNGSLKVQACVVCGDPKTHAHHDDYSKPLDVTWLCHIHHMERHGLCEALEREERA